MHGIWHIHRCVHAAAFLCDVSCFRAEMAHFLYDGYVYIIYLYT